MQYLMNLLRNAIRCVQDRFFSDDNIQCIVTVWPWSIMFISEMVLQYAGILKEYFATTVIIANNC